MKVLGLFAVLGWAEFVVMVFGYRAMCRLFRQAQDNAQGSLDGWQAETERASRYAFQMIAHGITPDDRYEDEHTRRLFVARDEGVGA